MTSRRAAVRALERAQVGEEASAALAIGAHGFILVDEGNECVAGDAVRLGGPIAPAIGGFNRGSERLSCKLGLCPRACCSMSSRNFRNMIQVSIGRRSRSPLRPLSLRMMSRQDLIRLPSCWAV